MSKSRLSAAKQAAHDVLAAEAFAMPAADPSLHHAPIVLPDDPTGIAEPHDVLAAEEFAMPAPHEPRAVGVLMRPEKATHKLAIAAAAGLLLLFALRVLRR